MTSEVPDEIGNPFDWSELYWGGFKPSTIGAVPLIDAHSTEDAVVNSILDLTRKKLKQRIENEEFYTKNGVKVVDYFVTLHDEYEKMEEPIATVSSEKESDQIDAIDAENDNLDEMKAMNLSTDTEDVVNYDEESKEEEISIMKDATEENVNGSSSNDDAKGDVSGVVMESSCDDPMQLKSSDKMNGKRKKRVLTICRLWHQNVFIGVRGTGGSDPGQFNFMATFDAKSGELISFEKWTD